MTNTSTIRRLQAAATALRHREPLVRTGAVIVAYWLDCAARDLDLAGAPSAIVAETHALAAIARHPSTAIRGSAPDAAHRIDQLVPLVAQFHANRFAAIQELLP